MTVQWHVRRHAPRMLSEQRSQGALLLDKASKMLPLASEVMEEYEVSAMINSPTNDSLE